MKSISILSIFLIFVAVVTQASPVKRCDTKIGPNLYTDGVRFKDLYAGLSKDLIKINNKYDEFLNSFHDSVTEAAKKDGLPLPDFLDVWNNNYKEFVADSKFISEKLAAKAAAFGKKLEEAKKKS
ncbi:2185_t:CDS:1 [Acaulospora morrowiae]|uniref:2185_t:CDS:1 n=1 Tax=Acaulospora morrowiae TaxID=94023 RepID=A0A9N9HST7_9GLOM|nr:2185_t:CDS:1 [Acaulospora morrowiae]